MVIWLTTVPGFDTYLDHLTKFIVILVCRFYSSIIYDFVILTCQIFDVNFIIGCLKYALELEHSRECVIATQ